MRRDEEGFWDQQSSPASVAAAMANGVELERRLPPADWREHTIPAQLDRDRLRAHRPLLDPAAVSGVAPATIIPPRTPVAPEEGPLAATAPRGKPRWTQQPPVPAEGRPGYCSDHPNVPLVTPRQAGRRWDRSPHATVCLEGHPPDLRDRCMYCGGPVYYAGERPAHWGGRPRRYCSRTCRSYHWRWRRAHPRRIP